MRRLLAVLVLLSLAACRGPKTGGDSYAKPVEGPLFEQDDE